MDRLFRMTPQQAAWLKANSSYRPAEPLRKDLKFAALGTLSTDGHFLEATPGHVHTIEPGDIWVGVPQVSNA